MSRLKTAAATHTGYLRTTNQDLALATSDLAAVADGMGGHLGGEVAARIAVEQLLESYRRDRTTEGLLTAVSEANEAVYHRSRAERNLRGMGTTLTAVAVVGDEPDGQLRFALVNVGDSRAYLLDRSGRRVHKLTEDHSVVEEMVRSGELTPEEAAVHPHKHILTRALGIEPTIEADCWELDLEPGSRLLLCSDGLTNELGEQDIAEVLTDKTDVDSAARELVRLALRSGGSDNVTVVVLEVLAEEASAPPDEVVMLPVVVGGAPEPAAGEAAAITEVVAVTPPPSATPNTPAPPPEAMAPSVPSDSGPAVATGVPAVPSVPSDSGPAARPASGQGAWQDPTTALGTGNSAYSDGVPRAVHTRPMVLVPQAKQHKPPGDRIVTIRVALFVLVFVAVLGGAAGVVVWFDKASYFVGLDKGYVAIFQGRPGGMLWFKPSVVERTTLTPTDLLASNVVYLRQGMETSSYQSARDLVHDLSLERTLVGPVTTTSSPRAVTTTTSGVFGSPAAATTTTGAPVAVTTTTGAPVPTTTSALPAEAPTTTTALPAQAGTTTTVAPVAVTTTTSNPGTVTTTTSSPGTVTTPTGAPAAPTTTTTPPVQVPTTTTPPVQAPHDDHAAGTGPHDDDHAAGSRRSDDDGTEVSTR